MKQDMGTWYRTHAREHADDELTKVRVSRKLFGEVRDKTLRTKAAQTWTFLLYLLHAMTKHRARLGPAGTKHLEAARVLVAMVRLFQQAPPLLTQSDINAAWDLWKRHLALTEDQPDMEIPKRHVIIHLLEKLPWFGNPRLYANWVDETLNKNLKTACRTISQQTFEQSLLIRMPEVLHDLDRKRKRY
jgi:hypothetical protein